MARRRYRRSEPTRRAVGPASRRIQPGKSLIGTGAVAASQTSRPAGQERVGAQTVQASSPTAKSQSAWEQLHEALGSKFKWPWDR